MTKKTLKEIRKEYALTQAQVAELLGFSRFHISRCENGKRNLSKSSYELLLLKLEKIEEETRQTH